MIIVEDILDTGLTLGFLKEYVLGLNPASLKICTLLDKPPAGRCRAPTMSGLNALMRFMWVMVLITRDITAIFHYRLTETGYLRVIETT